MQILLEPWQAATLADAGDCFAVVHRASRTEQPDINRAWVLSVIPCRTNQANAAVRVATGQSLERKKPNPSKP